VRHLKIKELKDIQCVAVSALLKEARKNALELVEDDGWGHEGDGRPSKTRQPDLRSGENLRPWPPANLSGRRGVARMRVA